MDFYFDKYEHRTPAPPTPYSATVELLWQFFATMAIVFGAWYIHWRWVYSLNLDALWFSIPLAFAETCAYIGLILFIINLWKTKDYDIKSPPEFISECSRSSSRNDSTQRRISVDVFFPTYNEEPELVRLSIIDAKKITYPHNIDITIYVLDDGKREEMKKIAAEENVKYLTRENNMGFKAGNIRNGMQFSSGDFIVICDADNRPFPTILKNTLGYFRDPRCRMGANSSVVL